MAEPDTTVRWHAGPPPEVMPRLAAMLLGLVTLTGCAWAVIAAHAWLSLLSGCSRWLVSSVQKQPEALAAPAPPVPRPPPAEARAALPAPTPAPPALTPGPPALPAAGGTPGASEQGSWPEPLSYGGNSCTGVFVYAVTLNESAPRRSAVSLATSANTPARYVRPGQRVDGWEVLSITDDWTGANPVVWLARDEEVCRARLTGNPARVKAVQLAAQQREAQVRAEAQRRKEERRRQRRKARRRRR